MEKPPAAVNKVTVERTFKMLRVEVNSTDTLVNLECAELGWRYAIPLYDTPGHVAQEMRRIADWLENLNETTARSSST